MLTQIPGASRSPELKDSFPAGAAANILLSSSQVRPSRSSVHTGAIPFFLHALKLGGVLVLRCLLPLLFNFRLRSVHGALRFSSEQELLGPTLRCLRASSATVSRLLPGWLVVTHVSPLRPSFHLSHGWHVTRTHLQTDRAYTLCLQPNDPCYGPLLSLALDFSRSYFCPRFSSSSSPGNLPMHSRPFFFALRVPCSSVCGCSSVDLFNQAVSVQMKKGVSSLLGRGLAATLARAL